MNALQETKKIMPQEIILSTIGDLFLGAGVVIAAYKAPAMEYIEQAGEAIQLLTQLSVLIGTVALYYYRAQKVRGKNKKEKDLKP